MRAARMLGCLGLLATLAGCGDPLLSVHPLYTEETAVFEPALLGRWATTDTSEMLTFEKSGKREYRLLYSSGDGDSIYVAHLVQLGSSLFLDVTQERAVYEQLEEDEALIHLVAVHTLHRIRVEGDRLDAAYFNAFWLHDKIRAKEISLPLAHPSSGGSLLTAPTEELQGLVAQYADEPGAFEPLDEFYRLPDEGRQDKPKLCLKGGQ